MMFYTLADLTRVVSRYLLAILGQARRSLRHMLVAFSAVQVIFNFALLITLYGRCGSDLISIVT